tara:strand:+ start:139 stop:513 length:375 start_codon:yes stop_codon:yes gene_type:complete
MEQQVDLVMVVQELVETEDQVEDLTVVDQVEQQVKEIMEVRVEVLVVKVLVVVEDLVLLEETQVIVIKVLVVAVAQLGILLNIHTVAEVVESHSVVAEAVQLMVAEEMVVDQEQVQEILAIMVL